MYLFIVSNIILIIVFILLLKIHSNRMIFPIIFLLYWWIFNGIGYAVYHNQYQFRFEPFAWIACCCACVIFGHRIGYSINCDKKIYVRSKIKNQRILTENSVFRLISVLLIACILNDIVSIIRNGQIGFLFSPSGLLSILNSSEAVKASGNSIDGGSIIAKLLGVAYSYCCILFGYTYLSSKRVRSLRLKVLFIIKILLNVITTAGKFSIIIFAVMFVSGMITNLLRDGKLVLRNIRYGKLFIYMLAGGLILYFLMNNRAGKSVGLSGILAYGFGEIPSFNYWYVDGVHERTYGVQSFYGVVSHLISGIPFAEGETNYPLAICAPKVNIFTMFRAIISDFGHTGGLLIMFLMGVSAGSAYRKLSYSGFANGWLALLFGALFLGFLMPLGYYLTLLLGYVVFLIFMTLYYKYIDFIDYWIIDGKQV